jgi:hypothetical protein
MNNRRLSSIELLMLALALNIVTVGFAPAAAAATFGTGDYIAWEQRQQSIDRVSTFLGEERVQAQLISLGVDPIAAQQRVASMTPAELALLEQRIDELPAGGNTLAIIGAVFVFILVLEIFGVTNIIGTR